MNRLKGSIIAKLIAWLLMVVSAVVCIGSLFLVLMMEDYGVFRQKREEAIEEQCSYISESYVVRALDNYRNGLIENSEKYFNKDRAFCYGIIESRSIDDIDLNNENSYLYRNFAGQVKEEELQVSSFRLGDEARIWCYEGLFGENCYFQEDYSSQTLYADRICYDTTGGIFYYRAEGKYYPVQKVSIRARMQMDDIGYKTDYYTFEYDNEKKMYQNLYFQEALAVDSHISQVEYDKTMDEAEVSVTETYSEEYIVVSAETGDANSEVQHKYEMHFEQPEVSVASEARKLLQGKQELTFNMFDGTELDYAKWNTLLFDGIRELNASELTMIDSSTMLSDEFVEVEEAYLDEYYTLHVQEKNAVKDYTVVSYVDSAVIEAEKEKFLKDLGKNANYLEKLEAIMISKDVNSYARVSVLIDMLYEIKTEIAGVIFGTFGIFIVCFIFLLCAAGCRKRKEEIVPTFLDKIPLDVLCLITFLLEVFAVVVLMEIGRIDSIIILMQLYTGIGIIMASLAMLSLLSFSVRVKVGKWWRNSLTYWIFVKLIGIGKVILYGCYVLWKNIHILLKFMVWVLGVGILVTFIGAFLGVGKEFMVAMLVADIVVCPIVLWMILQFQKLQIGSGQIAEGNLQYKIDTKRMFWEFKKHAENLNRINEGMAHAVDERMKSERFKTELITNVSHDIKTPLTSIVNYVDLLEKTDIQNEDAKEYLEVLERQSARLKKLIEDLIEASKASTGNLKVNLEELEANVFVTQILGEFEEKISQAGLELIVNKSEEEMLIVADGRHLWRVVDNLMNNICKYAQPESRVYIDLEQSAEITRLTFRNISKYQLHITSEELMERFVRGDSSRSTEGNGLGLAIAKSLMELMKGRLLLSIDGDLFKVILEFPR